MKNKKQFNMGKGLFYIMLFLIVFLGICLIFVLAKKPLVLVEYRNQSCGLVDNGWIKEYQPVFNWTFTGDIMGDQYGYDKVPDNYTMVEVYREVCSEGMNCKYFKQKIYFKNGEVKL